MGLVKELEFYLEENHQKSPVECVEFLINAWNLSSFDTTEKYEAILNIFMKDFLGQLLTTNNYDLSMKFLKLIFPQNSVSNDVIKMILKSAKQILEKEQSLNSIQLCTTLCLNESYKEFFKNNLNIYCKLLGSSLKCFNETQCQQFEIVDDIIFELHYFEKSSNFHRQFRQHVLLPLYQTTQTGKYGKIDDLWNLIKSIFFSRSSLNNEDSALNLFSDQEITFEQMEVLTESFIISFKSESTQIIRFLNHFNEDVLSKHENENEQYLYHVEMLYRLLKKYDVELTALKKLESTFKGFSSKVLDRLEKAINEMNLCEYLQVLSTIVSYDPFLFVENNFIYALIVECITKKKLASDLPQYEILLSTVLKIFGKDINQFIKKILSALESKLENFVVPKKRKRKITNESDSSSKKKIRLADGSSDSIHFSNIWPNSIKLMIDEIFAELNVNQTTKLWKILNDSLRKIISNFENVVIDENILFKVDFISSLICQLVTASRIHEHLIHKSSQITSAIDDFNDLQHRFYKTIIKIEYNNRIMNAFLKMSYDYENFIMVYFYHYNEEDKSELDSIFIADKSRIKSAEWKIIQQRIKNFGKVEEKGYSNLLMVQHFIKCKLFKISNSEDQNDFLQNLILDKEQISLLLEQKDVRLHIFNLLSDESTATNLIENLCFKIDGDQEKLLHVLKLVKNNSKLMESFLTFILNNCINKNHETIEILKRLPISFLSQECKKMIIQKLLINMDPKYLEEHHFDFIIIFNKVFKNDGYKTFFKDFNINNLIEKLTDISKFRPVYEIIIRTSLKKITKDVLENLEMMIRDNSIKELEELLAKCITEVNIAPTNECSLETIKNLKLRIVQKLSSNLNEKYIIDEQHAFGIFSRFCTQNIQILQDEIKDRHLSLLNKLLKLITKSSALDNTIELFMLTLKDANKLNLNDEIKAGIVKVLKKHLNNIIEDAILKQDKSENIDRERELISTLSSFKNNCREECSQFLHKLIIGRDIITEKQLIYSFMIYEILFEGNEKSERKDNQTLIKNYMRHCDNFVTEKGKVIEIDLLRAIYSSHIAMMKCNKEKLDFLIIDQIFTFHIDQRYRPKNENIEDFCKYYEIVGQFLFVLGNFHQNYFKSRIPQYFKAYNRFLDAIYFYKCEDNEDYTAKESSMLLRLTLQMENIMKMLMKLHSNSFCIISPYIVTSIVKVFIKNPKMLNVGDKFKVNIKNICYQLLSTFDDKTRKHICAVADESTRDVYDNLFKELKRK